MAELEQLRTSVEQKIEQRLETEPSFSGARYTGLDLTLSDFSQWRDRPLIQGAIEPFNPREDIRIILTDHLAQSGIESYKTIQLRIDPIEEVARVRYVYNLKLTVGSPKHLSQRCFQQFSHCQICTSGSSPQSSQDSFTLSLPSFSSPALENYL